MHSKVVVKYGPYEANGIIKHRPQRLHGLIAGLIMFNFPYEVIETGNLDRASIEIMKHEICSFKITNLEFNHNFVDDMLATVVLEQIQIHEELFNVKQNVPGFVSINEGMRWKVWNEDQNRIQEKRDVSLIDEEAERETEEDFEGLRRSGVWSITGSESYYGFNKTFIPSLETIVESDRCSCTDSPESTSSEASSERSLKAIFTVLEDFGESNTSLSLKLEEDESVSEETFDFDSVYERPDRESICQNEIVQILLNKLKPESCGGMKSSLCNIICECSLDRLHKINKMNN